MGKKISNERRNIKIKGVSRSHVRIIMSILGSAKIDVK